MRPVRAACLAAVAAVAAALLALAAAPASAHVHPSAGAENSKPAVVYIQTSVQVDIVLIVPKDLLGLHGDQVQLTLVSRRYVTKPLASGSGFTVNPDGTVVTARSIVAPDLRAARVFAANSVFHDYFHVGDLPTDYTTHRIGDATLNPSLQACYSPGAAHSSCVAITTPVIRVFPLVDPPVRNGLVASLLSPASGAGSDPVVIKVGGNNMPTVNLATKFSGVQPFTLLGFTAPPSGQDPPQAVVAHYAAPGLAVVKPEDVARVRGSLAAGVHGGPLVDDAQASKSKTSGHVVAMMVDGPSGPKTIPVETIMATLQAAGVQASRSPADAAYADAMGYFSIHHYTPAVPRLRDVLRLYRDHGLAKHFLRVAQQLAGGPQDMHDKMGQPGTATAATGGTHRAGLPGWWPYPVAAVLVLAAAVAVVLLRRRRGAAGEPGEPDAAPAASAPPSPEPRSSEVPTVLVERGASRQASPAPSLAAMVVRSSGERAPSERPSAGGAKPAAPEGNGPPAPQAAALPLPGPPSVAFAFSDVARRAYCTRCGADLAPEYRYCGHCGYPVE